MEFIPKLDFGPPEPLSLSTTRKPARAPKPAQARPPRSLPIVPILIGSGVVILAAMVALAVPAVLRAMKDRPSTPKAAPLSAETPETPRPPPASPGSAPAEFAIREADGEERPEASLRDAIRHASGRDKAEIVVRSKALTRPGEVGKALRVPRGLLVIRADGDAHPELLIELSKKAPWIEVGPQARLSLIGFKIRQEVPIADSSNAPPPALIASLGNVSLEKCEFSTTGSDRSSRVLASEGLDTRITDCFFEGFDRPLALQFYPGADVRLTNSIFVRDITGDPLAGWAIGATGKTAINGTKPRKLSLDRCTVLGAGLLAAEGFSAEAPLDVSLKQTAVSAKSLLLTELPRPALAKAIHWSGQEDWFAISEASWAMVAPKAFDALAGGLTDLKAWTAAVGPEAGSREEVLPFAAGSPKEGSPPRDFAITVENGQPPAGAKLGP